jgi:23S rRNA (cytosine1962-C5)-methyltransferase
LRIITRSESPEDDFIAARLRAAAAFRQETLALQRVTETYRVCHAEGDGLSGLIVDRYADVLAVELFSRGFFILLDRVRAVLTEIFPGARIHVRADEEIQRLEGFRLPAEPPPQGVVVKEHEISYRVDFERGHKTGFFCDQRENRLRVRELAGGRDTLDLCSYTGGFALNAFRGGAKKVIGVDLDEDAIETARQNARLNRAGIEFLHADLFNYLKQTRERFDLVVLDPPKMARDREELPRARRAYRDMNALALGVLRPGGIVVSSSCSGLVGEEEFLMLLRDAARAAGRELATFRIAGAGPDHPISSMYPEGRYLKVVFSRVR